NKHSFDIPQTGQQTVAAPHNFETEALRTRREPFKRSSFEPRRDTQTNKESIQSEPPTEESVPAAVPPAAPVITSFWTRKLPFNKTFEQTRLLLLLILLTPLTIFAFYPAWENIVYSWTNKVDYGHGFFVIPLTALFLYLRFDTYPGTRYKVTWLGLFPIAVCCVMRLYASNQYLDSVEEWSIFFWLLGLVWFFYGTRVFIWALPPLLFLVFMFQLPYRFETLAKHNLQQIAAQFAAVLLQLFGEPAIPIKNTIRLSTMELGVEAACSGIRFLVSIAALAAAAILLMRRPWWQNIFVVLVAAPLALFVNAARITLTGILLVHLPGFVNSITPKLRSPSAVADELSGYVMIGVAFLLFAGFLWYLGKVFQRVEYA
ncbi:MAG: exosortase/archaeosortase family protein, partial [Planctomycetaceae bacterium]|nr:exosortase/archaeosortase family protein [Planctomycetaceae bacterium]